MNAAEDLLSVHLDELGCEYSRQYVYAHFRALRADFAVWPTERTGRLLVEVQGGIYGRGGKAHSSIAGILRDLDRAQQACLNEWYYMPVSVQQVESGEAKEFIRRWLEG